MENLFTLNSIRTVSGIYVNVIEPTLDMFNIEDIAHALSFQCRFAGHLPTFYSVAQHSVACANYLDVKDKLSGLMHDASEAYLLDIPSPIKGHLTNYKEIEDKMMRLIAEKFSFQYPLSPEVKEADNKMLHFEWNNIMLTPKTTIECWSPQVAKQKFLEKYYELLK